MSYKLPALNNLVGRLDRLPKDSAIANKVRGELIRLQKESALLAGFTGDVDRSEAFNLRTRNDTAEKLRDRSNKAAAELGKLIADFRSEQRKTRLEKANLREGLHSAEIRQVFRAMSTTEKHQFIGDAIKAGDSAAIACLTNVPPVLVGLSAEQQEQYREAFLAKFSPDETDETDELEAIVKTSLQMVEAIAAPVGVVVYDGQTFAPEMATGSTT